MCTVTIIPLLRPHDPDGDHGRPAGLLRGVRLACNRDESRQRPAALAPQERTFGPRRALLPIDPVSDGTWIAVNDAGLCATLLNVYSQPVRSVPGEPARRPHWSRGTIIPALLHCSDVSSALRIAEELDAGLYPPFRLILVDRTAALGDVRSNGRALSISAATLTTMPVLYTSSGLGDQVVDAPRRALFQDMFAMGCDPVRQQDAFHRHQWPQRPDVSVRMSRAEARSVSLTVVELAPDRVRIEYFGDPPDWRMHPVIREIRSPLAAA